MKIKRASVAKCCANAGLLVTLLSVEAHAQDVQRADESTSGTSAVEEVTVTASRREERLQDVAIAVAVLNPDDFANGGLTELTSILPFVPGVAVQESGATYRSDIYIRGINATGAGGVGTYVDDIPYGSSTKDAGGGAPIDSTLLDLENLSVLKGPQGNAVRCQCNGRRTEIQDQRPLDVCLDRRRLRRLVQYQGRRFESTVSRDRQRAAGSGSAVYVTNLTDEYGHSNITTSTTAPATAIPLRPQTFGVMLKTRF